MLVYMFLNTVTEKAYVGATEKTLEARWDAHCKSARAGSTYRFHRALRDWPEEVWLKVVLANCYSLEELNEAEKAWLSMTAVQEEGVGYNSPSSVSYATSVTNGKKGGAPRKENMERTSPVAGLTDEQAREWYAQQGKKGGDPIHASVRASSPLAGMTAEERREYFREAGRRGAAKSKSNSVR